MYDTLMVGIADDARTGESVFTFKGIVMVLMCAEDVVRLVDQPAGLGAGDYDPRCGGIISDYVALVLLAVLYNDISQCCRTVGYGLAGVPSRIPQRATDGTL